MIILKRNHQFLLIRDQSISPTEISTHQRNKGSKFNSETWVISFKHRSFTNQERLYQQSLNIYLYPEPWEAETAIVQEWEGPGPSTGLHWYLFDPCWCFPASMPLPTLLAPHSVPPPIYGAPPPLSEHTTMTQAYNKPSTADWNECPARSHT